MHESVLGRFTLGLEESGKLARLSVDGLASFLSASVHREQLAPGLFFEPRGWDECFPTIEPFDQSPVMGEILWATPRLSVTSQAVVQEWTCSRFTAKRTFTVPSSQCLDSAFLATNRSGKPMPFLWASHALFSFAGLRRVEFAGGPVLEAFSVDGSSNKRFIKNRGSLRLIREDGEILMRTDQPFWGLWYNRGGWPAARPAGVGCIGLEPTNSKADKPVDGVLEPDQAFSGRVQLEVLI